eukprot:g3216.t1 g3216   contig12:1645347-1647450(+)
MMRHQQPPQQPPDDGDLPFHKATFLASHNAHANRDAASSFFETLGINQDSSIYDQLSNNDVRGLLLDIKLDPNFADEQLRLVHGPLDFGGFSSVANENLIPFLEENPNAIVTLILETTGDSGEYEATIRANILKELQTIFSALSVNGQPLKEITFKYDDLLWQNHDNWPTLSEIRQSGQRLFIFSDRSELANSEYGFMHNQQVMKENYWEGVVDCIAQFGWDSSTVSLPSNQSWSRLFMMNHFCCESGAESFGRVVGEALLGGGDNGWGILYPRIQNCMANNGGVTPNFIALDWVVNSEEARAVRDYLKFGGAVGRGQTCDDDSQCATSSCNTAAGICQCQECASNSLDICPGCASGQYCQSAGDSSANQCIVKERIENSYVCSTSFDSAVASCNTAVRCPNGNDDCPVDQVCFNAVDCLPAPTLQPTDQSSSSSSSDATTSVQVQEITTTVPATAETSESPSAAVIEPTAAPITPASRYCGESYEDAKTTCSEITACPKGYECPSGLTCYDGVKCFTRRPTSSPTDTPTTASPISPPSASPVTDAPIAPSMSPTDRPTRAPFDFFNEYFCGGNFTEAQSSCYTTTPCPTGSPASCLNGETCYGGIKCIAPPSISPTLQPTDKPPTKSPSAVVQEQTTSPPFNWLNTNGGMAAMSGGYAIVAMIVGVAGVMLW